MAVPVASAGADHVSIDHAAAACSAAQSPKTAHAGTSATSMPMATGTIVSTRECGNITR